MKILDATAGQRAMWFDKNYPDAIYIDIREEMNPTVVGDIMQSPFRDGTFDLIVFDPPHNPTGPENKGIFAKQYGRFLAEQIRTLVIEGSKDLSRVLKINGILIFKWNTHGMDLGKILRLVSHGLIPLFGQRTAERTKHSSKTYWICYTKARGL